MKTSAPCLRSEPPNQRRDTQGPNARQLGDGVGSGVTWGAEDDLAAFPQGEDRPPFPSQLPGLGKGVPAPRPGGLGFRPRTRTPVGSFGSFTCPQPGQAITRPLSTSRPHTRISGESTSPRTVRSASGPCPIERIRRHPRALTWGRTPPTTATRPARPSTTRPSTGRTPWTAPTAWPPVATRRPWPRSCRASC